MPGKKFDEESDEESSKEQGVRRSGSVDKGGYGGGGGD